MSHNLDSSEVRAVQRCIKPGCRQTYGLNERLYVCRRCEGLLDIERSFSELGNANAMKAVWQKRWASLDPRDRSGVWRYRELLPFAENVSVISLAEGNTPLYDAPRAAEYCNLPALKLKHQGCNPSGSFKDTGMTTAVTQAVLLGARIVVCASTGNTSASLAAYAARANLACAILVPEGQVSSAKLAQSLDYGARVLEIEGNFDTAMRIVRELSEDESIYLVNSINPFRIEGQKTVAAELLQQMDWQVPDHLVLPGGNLGNSSAFGKGLWELRELGLIDRLPRISVVQAAGAAPFAHLFEKHEHSTQDDDVAADFAAVEYPTTLATAIKIGAPVSWEKAWRAIQWTKGRVLTVSEEEIADAKAIIGRDGIGCEPASATTVAGIRQLVQQGKIDSGESVVAVLTGHLLKDPDYVMNYHRGTLDFNDGSSEFGGRRIHGKFANRPVRVKADVRSILQIMDHCD
ncbi:MAG: threonine synthase [Acidobacteriota bacterium]|nr:threonine synthase [Acidobacteriota bacterium]